MANNLQRSSGTGHMLRTATGHLAKGCRTRVCFNGCQQKEPTYWTGSFSGVGPCPLTFSTPQCTGSGSICNIQTDGFNPAAGTLCFAPYLKPMSNVFEQIIGTTSQPRCQPQLDNACNPPFFGNACCTWVAYVPFNEVDKDAEGVERTFLWDYAVTLSFDTNGWLSAKLPCPRCATSFTFKDPSYDGTAAPSGGRYDCTSSITLVYSGSSVPCGTCSGGICHEMWINSGATLTVSPTTTACPKTTPNGCDLSVKYCLYQFSITYNCQTGSFSTPSIVQKACQVTSPTTDFQAPWVQSATTAQTRTWTRWSTSFNVCTTGTDCPDVSYAGSVPSAPDCCNFRGYWETSYNCRTKAGWTTPTLVSSELSDGLSTSWAEDHRSGDVVYYRRWYSDSSLKGICGQSATSLNASATPPPVPTGDPTNCAVCPLTSDTCPTTITASDSFGDSTTVTRTGNEWDGEEFGDVIYCDQANQQWVASLWFGYYTAPLHDGDTCPPSTGWDDGSGNTITLS